MSTLCYLLEVTATILLFSFGLHYEFTKQKKRFVISGILVALFGIYVCLDPLPIPSTFFISFIILFLFKGNVYLKILYYLIYTLLEGIVVSGYVFILSRFITYKYLPLFQKSDIIFYSISCLICLFVKYTHNHHNKLSYGIKKVDFLLIIFIIIISFSLCLFTSVLFFKPISIIGQRLVVFLILSMICMSVLILFLYFKLQHYHQILEQSAEHTKKALKLEELHYLDMQQKNKDLRAFRHDYNHHILAMQELAKQKNYEKLKNYIENLSQIKEHTHYLSTNHVVGDAIVNYFYEHLPKQTQFELLGKFSTPLAVEESDLCIILSNLLKNAVEAIEKIPLHAPENTKNERILILEISSDAHSAQVMLENSSLPYSPGELKHLNTSKTDTLNHGLGLQNVKQVVHKYNGTIDMKWENGRFSTCIYLSL